MLLAQLLLVSSISSLSMYTSGDIVFEDVPPEPWTGIVQLRVNITTDPEEVDEVIFTIDGDVNTSRTLTHLGNGTWGLDLDTTDLSDGDHTYKITATMGDTAESAIMTCACTNAIRIVFIDVPEKASGFLLLRAKIIDERLNTTNVWYNIDAGEGLLLPHYRDDLFRIVIDVDGYPDGLHTFTVKTINIDDIVAMKSVDVAVANGEADVRILSEEVDGEIPPNGGVEVSGNVYNLTVLAGGLPVNATNVWYGVDGDIWGRVPHKGDHVYGLTVTTSNLTNGNYRLFVVVLDDEGVEIASDETVLNVIRPQDVGFSWSEWEQLPFVILLAVIAAVILATAGAYRVATRRKVFPPEDVFLIYSRNGVLIHHQGSAEAAEAGDVGEGADKDLMTSMLVAIQDFVMTSFQQDGERSGSDLKQIGLGNRTILLERSSNTVLALVVPALPKVLDLEKYEKFMVNLQRRIESSYEEALGEWDGDRDQFKGVDELLIGAFKL